MFSEWNISLDFQVYGITEDPVYVSMAPGMCILGDERLTPNRM